MTQLKFVGLEDEDIETVERAQVESIAEKNHARIQMLVNNEYETIVHIKVSDRAGERKMFDVNVRVNYPGGKVTSEQQGWILTQTVKEAFDAVEHQFRSRFA